MNDEHPMNTVFIDRETGRERDRHCWAESYYRNHKGGTQGGKVGV